MPNKAIHPDIVQFVKEHSKQHVDTHMYYDFILALKLSDNATILAQMLADNMQKKIARHMSCKSARTMKTRLNPENSRHMDYYWVEYSSKYLQQVFGTCNIKKGKEYGYKVVVEELRNSGLFAWDDKFCNLKYNYCRKVRLQDLSLLNGSKTRINFSKKVEKKRRKLFALITNNRVEQQLQQNPYMYQSLLIEQRLIEQNKSVFPEKFNVSVANNGRICSPLKLIKKEIRNNLTLDGERLIEIDAVSCHYQELCKLIDVPFENYVDLCVVDVEMDRKLIKLQALQFLYSAHIENEFSKWLKENRETVWHKIKNVHKYHRSGFFKALGVREVEDMNNCLEALIGNSVDALNVYDALFVKESDVEYALELLQQYVPNVLLSVKDTGKAHNTVNVMESYSSLEVVPSEGNKTKFMKPNPVDIIVDMGFYGHDPGLEQRLKQAAAEFADW